MDYTIIIPTAFDKRPLVEACIKSILDHSNLGCLEILVVANGCTDDTEDYVRNLGQTLGDSRVRLLSFPKAIGYPRAINEGIKAARGQFVVPLNNDTVLLPQSRNQWLDMMRAPFADPNVAITGPWKNWCPHAERDFLIFFCVMIRLSAIMHCTTRQLPLLDAEAFGDGYGEDCDWCCRAEDKGWKVVQVPSDDKIPYDAATSLATGNFPIYHAANQTFKNWPGGEDLLRRNREILANRYGSRSREHAPIREQEMVDIVVDPAIKRAKTLDGFMSDAELLFLAETAKTAKVAIEVGSWHGRSSRAIADNLPEDGRLFCIDTWAGSVVEQDTNHASAKWLDGDHAFDEFCRGMSDHLRTGKVIPLRMHSKHAAKFLADIKAKADFIFIDGDHTYEGCRDDIASYRGLLNPGGVLCGHDYKNGMWPDVTRAVDEVFRVWEPEDTSIWVRSMPKIYDCFTFFNEVELLEIRLNEMAPLVDKFVIVEATRTHQGNPKPLYFQENRHRFGDFLHMIEHVVVDFPNEIDVWGRERMQRDHILVGLERAGARDTDIAVISDCDEIPSCGRVAAYSTCEYADIYSLDQELFYYNFTTKSEKPWREAKVARVGDVRRLTPCGVRYSQTANIIKYGGWHFSYMGGLDRIQEKIKSWAHHEYNLPEVIANVKANVASLKDLFGRDETFRKVPLGSSLPSYVLNHASRFRELGWTE